MRYRAVDLYAFLIVRGCARREPDGYRTGDFGTTRDSQVFLIPHPDLEAAGVTWLDADVLDENLRGRWIGLPVPLPLKRHH